MEWHFTVTEKSMIAIQKHAVQGTANKKSSQKSSLISPSLVFLLLIAVLILLFNLWNNSFFSRSHGFFFSRLFLAACSFILLFSFFASKKVFSSSSGKHSSKVGFCKCRAEGDWFYFLRSVPDKETIFYQKPLREITRISAQNGGLLIVFSNVIFEFLPSSAFTLHTLSESQQYLQELCIAALRREELDRPLSEPFPCLPATPHEPLLSCSFTIPHSDTVSIYCHCMQNLTLRPWFYWEYKKLYLPMFFLTIWFLILFTRTHSLSFLAIALILPISVLSAPLYLKFSVKRQSQEGKLEYMCKPQKFSICSDSLVLSSPDSVIQMPYNRFYGIYSSKTSYYLATKKPCTLFFLPKKAFSTDLEKDMFIHSLKQKIRESRKTDISKN